MRIVFFDLATVTGWASGDFRSAPTWGTFELPRTGDDVADFLIRGEARIEEILGRTRAEFVGFEAPILNRKRDTVLKIRKLGGLANEVEKAARRRRLPCREYTLGEIRTHFLGRGFPRETDRVKIAVKNKCRRLGWKIRDDNEADALAGLSLVQATMKPDRAAAVMPLFQSDASRARGRAIPKE